MLEVVNGCFVSGCEKVLKGLLLQKELVVNSVHCLENNFQAHVWVLLGSKIKTRKNAFLLIVLSVLIFDFLWVIWPK